jgi:hypothetical protein
MATFSKVKLSGSTSGRGIEVVATATAGTAIHTAVAGASDIDEIWIYAVNTSAADVNLTLEWGGVAVPDDTIGPVTIKAYSGLVLVAPGLILNGGLALAAFASVASVISIHGYVNRITA